MSSEEAGRCDGVAAAAAVAGAVAVAGLCSVWDAGSVACFFGSELAGMLGVCVCATGPWSVAAADGGGMSVPC